MFIKGFNLIKFVIKIGAIVFLSACSSRVEQVQKPQQTAIVQEPKKEPNLEINQTKPKAKLDFTNLKKQFLKTKKGGDCSGFILEVNSLFDDKFLNTTELLTHYDASGRRSQAMYNMLKAKNQLTQTGKKGSLVFFKNTTQKLKNSKSTNITHLGIVVNITNNTYEIMHFSSNTIKLDYMNLVYKNLHKLNGKIINSYILRNCSGSTCLLSNRFVAFANFLNENK